MHRFSYDEVSMRHEEGFYGSPGYYRPMGPSQPHYSSLKTAGNLKQGKNAYYGQQAKAYSKRKGQGHPAKSGRKGSRKSSMGNSTPQKHEIFKKYQSSTATIKENPKGNAQGSSS